MASAPDPDRRPKLRAGDDDRQRVAERLRRAHDEGRLDLDEYDQRVTAAYAARTYADLEALTTDLPPERAARVPAAEGASRGDAALARRAPDRAAVRAWATASVVNVLLWGVIAVAATGPVYPWWIWVAGPWGVVLLMRWIASRSDPQGG